MKLIGKIYKKYKEAIDYLFWGGVAFVLSMVLFYIFANVMNIYEQIANILSWIICVIFTYLTNRTFVFQSKVKGIKNIFNEFKDFVTAKAGHMIQIKTPLQYILTKTEDKKFCPTHRCRATVLLHVSMQLFEKIFSNVYPVYPNVYLSTRNTCCGATAVKGIKRG